MSTDNLAEIGYYALLAVARFIEEAVDHKDVDAIIAFAENNKALIERLRERKL